jgi:hypothetical protein
MKRLGIATLLIVVCIFAVYGILSANEVSAAGGLNALMIVLGYNLQIFNLLG